MSSAFLGSQQQLGYSHTSGSRSKPTEPATTAMTSQPSSYGNGNDQLPLPGTRDLCHSVVVTAAHRWCPICNILKQAWRVPGPGSHSCRPRVCAFELKACTSENTVFQLSCKRAKAAAARSDTCTYLLLPIAAWCQRQGLTEEYLAVKASDVVQEMRAY